MRAAAAMLVVAAALLPGPLWAQTSEPVLLDSRPAVIADMVTTAKASAQRRAAPQNDVDRNLKPFGLPPRQLVATYLMAANVERPAYGNLLKALESARMDKQVGSAPNNNASTSLAMKGLAPKIFGVAVERGAATREVSGNAVTFRANPLGLVKALQGSGLLDLTSAYSRDALQRYASRASFAATFDVSRGTTPGVLTGDTQQLSGWSVRYEVINRRDPASPGYAAQWRDLLRPANAPYLASVNSLDMALSRWDAYGNWEATLRDNLDAFVEKPFESRPDVNRAADTYQRTLRDALTELEGFPVTPEVTDALSTYARELLQLQSSIDRIYTFAGKGPLLTLDWSSVRDTVLPDLNTGTVVFEAGLGRARKTDFTVNAGASVYRFIPVGATHALKTMNITAELEHPLGNVMPTATVSLGGRFSYIPYETVTASDSMTSGVATGTTTGVGIALKGAVTVVQAKLTIPVKDTGIRVPVSITASNRTELIMERNVRGSVGITFDLDTFVSALTGRR